MDQLLISF